MREDLAYLWVPQATLSMATVCRELRNVVKFYAKTFGEVRVFPTTWFDFDKDILYSYWG